VPICVALVPSRPSAVTWNRCARDALRGDCFCAAHRNALDGAMMGFLDTKEYRHAQGKKRPNARRKARRPDKKPKSARPRGQEQEPRMFAQRLRAPGGVLADFFRS
jgi:sRNA-binding protein